LVAGEERRGPRRLGLLDLERPAGEREDLLRASFSAFLWVFLSAVSQLPCSAAKTNSLRQGKQ
jgi:hypothetical protein